MEEDQIENYIKQAVYPDTRLLISNFAVLWNLYEDKLFDTNYSFRKVTKMIKDCIQNESIKVALLENYDKLFDYIQDKVFYCSEEELAENTANYFHVRIIKPGIQGGEITLERFSRILFGQKDNDKIQFLLLIVGRVRNNMFHGLKDIGRLNEQKELFKICNDTLWAFNIMY